MKSTLKLMNNKSINQNFFNTFSILNKVLNYSKRKFSIDIKSQIISKWDKVESEVQIREAQKNDITELEKFFLLVCKETFTKEVLKRSKIEDFQASIQNEKIFIAENDNTIIGFISFFTGTYSFIHNLFIHPNWQNKGIGKQLFKKSIKELQPPIELEILAHNTKACNFVESQGWKKILLQQDAIDPYVVYRYDAINDLPNIEEVQLSGVNVNE